MDIPWLSLEPTLPAFLTLVRDCWPTASPVPCPPPPPCPSSPFREKDFSTSPQVLLTPLEGSQGGTRHASTPMAGSFLSLTYTTANLQQQVPGPRQPTVRLDAQTELILSPWGS